MSITLEEATALATAAHEGQVDKAGKPYIRHVMRVMKKVDGYERKLAALGHDLLEDTKITQADLLAAGFPREVVTAIVALTKLPGESRIDAARRARANAIARDVKLADNADNSDPSRLPNPSEKDLARMREYTEVREILLEGAPPYRVAPQDLEGMTQLDMAFGTIKHLPPVADIPEEFYRSSNPYVKIVEAMFFRSTLPSGDVSFHEGFDPGKVVNYIRAHLRSFAPKHEHKIAGVAYMLSMMATVELSENESIPARQK